MAPDACGRVRPKGSERTQYGSFLASVDVDTSTAPTLSTRLPLRGITRVMNETENTPPAPEVWTVPWDAFPSEAEAETLTRENPKGRLFEFCQRTKCGRPKFTIEVKGTVHGAAMRILVHGRTLESGMQWAWERGLAEQMAARALLRQLVESEDAGEPGEWITKDEEARLRFENPKGSLLERCIVLRLTPVFDVRSIVAEQGPCFEASAHVVLEDGGEVWSDIRRSANAKLVEQAVARSLLGHLLAELPELVTGPASAPALAALTGEPRSILNELRQKGRLRDYGFVVERVEGPPHAPIFRMSGHAERATGERLTVDAIGAPSKKEGERLVALRLLELVAPSHDPK